MWLCLEFRNITRPGAQDYVYIFVHISIMWTKLPIDQVAAQGYQATSDHVAWIAN